MWPDEKGKKKKKSDYNTYQCYHACTKQNVISVPEISFYQSREKRKGCRLLLLLSNLTNPPKLIQRQSTHFFRK